MATNTKRKPLKSELQERFLDHLITEASVSVEAEFALEDRGWQAVTGNTASMDRDRVLNVNRSRWYWNMDPLAKQSIRLWTDYTFGSGMTWKAKEESAQKVLEAFYADSGNKGITSSQGQRKSSNKLLVDGEIFFAIFLGKNPQIRRIDPLEITEIITKPGDSESVLYYLREWDEVDGTNVTRRQAFYRDYRNEENEDARSSSGMAIHADQNVVIFHLVNNTLTARGNPLLLPALNWIKYYTKFLSARIAVMLAVAKFAWHTKIKGGSAAVAAVRRVQEDVAIAPGSNLLENTAVDTKAMKLETGATNAYQDARMLRLQVCAAVGISEQYYGDISIGNFATAKTVELPMVKMFSAYQKLWIDAFEVIDGIILTAAGIAEEKQFVDRDFPPIAPDDVAAAAKSLVEITNVIPGLKDIQAVKQLAITLLGLNNVNEVMEQLEKAEKELELTKTADDKAAADKNEGDQAQAAEDAKEARAESLLSMLYKLKEAIERGDITKLEV